jgi:hypothetical protein
MGGCAQCRHGQRIVVLSAVEERDLRLRKSDACRERLGRRRTAVICLRRGASGYGNRVCLSIRSGGASGIAVVWRRRKCVRVGECGGRYRERVSMAHGCGDGR